MGTVYWQPPSTLYPMEMYDLGKVDSPPTQTTRQLAQMVWSGKGTTGPNAKRKNVWFPSNKTIQCCITPIRLDVHGQA
jgi:hypothetical protein